ncbi:MAG: aminodeoxychorismate lyase [Firmicutes bacterium]|nr:aminodeoxychorismate lyase [Bacillota bacterium]
MQQYMYLFRKKIVIATIAAMLFMVIFYSFVINSPEVASLAAQKPVLITVRQGMGLQEIGDRLYQQGVIGNVTVFRMMAKLKGLENSLQAGDYAIAPGTNITRILEMLAKGETAYQQLTVPEGYTIDQIADLLEEKHLGLASRFKASAQKTKLGNSVLPSDPAAKYVAEGYAFPNTYRFSSGTAEEQILALMVKEFDKQITSELRDRAQAMGLPMRDVIILASLVEKEARLPEDRPVIAAVFMNRLRLGMPLQSCATIQYILGYPKPELSVQDTMLPSPYNTYKNMGLPPGPIANPGLASIKAVLYPAQTDYLYFVADKQGAHHFSKTYEEHLMMIEQVRN